MRIKSPIKRLTKYAALSIMLASAPTAHAENISKANKVLCASVNVVMCVSDGSCVSSVPWELNVPGFIEIDFNKQRLATTEASGENRQTPISQLKREDGLIFLQGVEEGRAFSFVIEEETGMATIAVARQELSVTVFGNCTPTK